MAAQEIAVTCKNCGDKTRCTVAEWSAGFACPHCGAAIQRPSPKRTDAKATAKIQLDSLIRPTVSAVSLSQPSPSESDVKKPATETGKLKIVKPAAPSTDSAQLKIIHPAAAVPAEPAPAADAPAPAVAAGGEGTAAVHRLSAENSSLRDNLKQVTIKHAKAEAELEVLRDQHTETTRKLNGLQDELVALKRARAKLQDQVRELTEDKATSSVTLQEDLAQVRGARDDAEAALAKLQVEHKIVKEKLDEFIKDKVDLGRKVKELDERFAKLEEERDHLSAEAVGIKQQRDALEKEKSELEEERQKLQAQTVELAKKVIPQDKLDEFKKRMAAEVTQNKVAAAKLAKASDELQKLRVDLAKKDAAVKALAKAKAVADHKLEESEKASAAASAAGEAGEKAALENKILREKLDGLISELHAHEDSIKGHEESARKLDASVKTLATERDDARAELDKAKAEIQQVAEKQAAELATLKAEIQALSAQLQEAEASPAAVAATALDPAQLQRLKDLEAEVTSLNQQLADLEDADNEDRKLLEEENQELKARISGLESAATDQVKGAEAEKTLELKKTLARALAENKIIKEKMTAMVADVQRSRAHIEAMGKVNEQLQEQVRAYAHEAPKDEDDSMRKLQELVSRVSELSSAKAALEKENAKLKADAKTASAAPVAAAAGALAGAGAEAVKLKALTDAKAALEAQVAELQAKLAAAPAAPAVPAAPAAPVDSADSDALMRAEIEAKIMREKIDELVAELDAAHQETEAAKKAAATAKPAAAPAAAPSGADGRKLAELEKAITDLKQQQSEAEKAKSTLEAELKSLKDQLATAKKAAPAAAPAAATASAAPAGTPAARMAEAASRIQALEEQVAAITKERDDARTEAVTARELLTDAAEPGKKKKDSPPDKVRIVELTMENKALNEQIEKMRKKVKDDRSEKIRGMMLPSVSEDVEALAHRNHELEHKLAALELERQQMLRELHDWRDDGQLNKSTDALEAKAVVMTFPEAAERIVRDLIGDAPVIYASSTQHKVDTGLWARKAPCYLAITADDVVVAAPGKTDVVQRIPRRRTADSFWNPVTQQLVFSPGLADVPLPSLTMTRADADAAMVFMRAERITVKDGVAAGGA